MEDSRHPALSLVHTIHAASSLAEHLYTHWVDQVFLDSDWLSQDIRPRTADLKYYIDIFQINILKRPVADQWFWYIVSDDKEKEDQANNQQQVIWRIMSDTGDAQAVLNQIKDIQDRDISSDEKNILINRILQSK